MTKFETLYTTALNTDITALCTIGDVNLYT